MFRYQKYFNCVLLKQEGNITLNVYISVNYKDMKVIIAFSSPKVADYI